MILLPSTGLAADELERLVHIAYLAEVTNYCSLADEQVARGFRLERDRLVAAGALGPEQIEQARSRAWQMGHAEWQNRGLGGFRAWCRTEGADAAEYFRALAEGEER